MFTIITKIKCGIEIIGFKKKKIFMNNILYSVKEILDEVFFDGVDESIALLKEYELYDAVEEHLGFLKEKKEEEIKKNFETITLLFIQTVNSKLHKIKDDEPRLELKYILTEIGNYIVDSIPFKNKELKSLREALISLSELKGYDYKDIESRLQISRLIRNSERSPVNTSNFDKEPYYEWLKEDYKIDEISNNLRSEGVIKSVKSFKKIFTPEPIEFQANSEKKDFLFVLFDTLYDEKIIRPKVKKGKFLALQRFGVDLHNEILYKKESKYIKQEIKKNKERHEKLREKVEKWIK